ncbi:hypothetical protein [Archangium sp.]|uniref:hypothetical protein n=1 Tax=Archangium sp. TaxID=1872627 RepID=UPI002D2BA674|nr:hypothetical protein [Archangium sp.]HYO57842.1 hypothetical protein [Archangium sp.]
MQHKGFNPLSWLAAVWVVIVLGCLPKAPTGSVQFVGRIEQTLSASDVTRVAVLVTAPGMAPLTTELVKTERQWGGTLGRIPAGTDRTFTAEAFGADGTKLYAGEATGSPWRRQSRSNKRRAHRLRQRRRRNQRRSGRRDFLGPGCCAVLSRWTSSPVPGVEAGAGCWRT